MKKLSATEIADKYSKIKDWKLEANAIKKEWRFKNFIQAMGFINQVAILAEKHNHHPELFNVYNKVTLKFYTHVAGGLTQKDFNIASEIDTIMT